MLHLDSRAAMARALTLDLDPRLIDLLRRRFAALVTPDGDLTDWTEYLIVQAGDTEADLVACLGASPLVDPVDGARWPDPAFRPHWDWLEHHPGWWEMILTYGNSFAHVLLIQDDPGAPAELVTMCREYAA